MAANQPLSLFISSRLPELSKELNAVQTALDEYSRYGWLSEQEIGARPDSAQTISLAKVAASDVYIGLFWLGYSQRIIDEFEYARKLGKPCLLYEKHVDLDHRSPELAKFLNHIQQVDHPDDLSICRFVTPKQLAEQVQSDLIRLLTTSFREMRRQPPPQPTSNSTTTSGKNKGKLIGTFYGNINQHNYPEPGNKMITVREQFFST